MENVLDIGDVGRVQFIRTQYEGEVWVTLAVASPLCVYRLKMTPTKAAYLADLLADCVRSNVRET
ncbi:unnamed protein product [marine sediment metagenome]|uniref:Uncharacterized protein n=1 Tax=marine sediment metagenome TaxID=412755 RepID=X1HDW4_9ZZZZ